MTRPEETVRAFCAAVVEHDEDAIRSLVTDDVVYHNMPIDPVTGVQATIDFLEGFLGQCDRFEIEITALAVEGQVVLTERVDTMWKDGRSCVLPVMGAFEVRDGRVSAWRDYFDMAPVMAFFAGEAGEAG